MGFVLPWRKKKQLEVVPLHKSSYFQKHATVVNGKVLEIETGYKTESAHRLKGEGKATIENVPQVGGALSRDVAERWVWKSWRHPDFDKLINSDEQLKIERDNKVSMLSGTPASTIPITVIPIGEKVSELTTSGTVNMMASSTGSIFYQLDETKKK